MATTTKPWSKTLGLAIDPQQTNKVNHTILSCHSIAPKIILSIKLTMIVPKT